MIYLLILILIIGLSIRYDINGNVKYRNECYLFVLLILILLSGLRYRLMIDTPNYIYNFYHKYPYLEHFTLEDYPIGQDPLYVLINSFVKSMGGRFYWVQLIQSTFVNILVFKYIKRHSSYIFTCVFFYSITYYFAYSMELMRAGFSIVICLYANDYLLNKRWFKGLLLYFFATLFHIQTLFILGTSFLFFLRLNKYSVIIFIIAFVVSRIIQKGLGDYLQYLELSDYLTGKATYYYKEDKYSDQIYNLNYFIVHIFPNIIYSIFSILYIKKIKPQSDILKIEPFVMAGVVFLFFQMNMEIAYRFVTYYGLHFTLLFAECFILIIKTGFFSRGVACLRALVCFFPFFFFVGYSTYIESYTFIPYSSVIDRDVNTERESKYVRNERPRANENEY